MKKEDRHAYHLSTRLTKKERAQFCAVKKYVVGWCGKNSNAEVLRYLVREWSKEDHS